MTSPAPRIDCERFHASLLAPDLDAAIDFYTNKLGFTFGFTWGDPIRIAGVNLATGKAISPRLLIPAAPNVGFNFARVSPFMISCFGSSCANFGPDPYNQGFAAAGIYDRHAIYRQRHDIHPIFSADDSRVIFSSGGGPHVSTRVRSPALHASNRRLP